MDAPPIALVHDWLTGMRGGERCLERLCRHWPDAHLFTLFHVRGSVSSTIEQLRPRTTFLQCLPGIERYYRYLLPILPIAANWRVRDVGAVVSLSHCVAKAVQPPPGIPHICYCFTPMRYAWHMREAYFPRGKLGRFPARVLDGVLGRLREWDRRTSERVSHFVAISKTVQQRIQECYGRDSIVIYPPADVDYYTPDGQPREDYYLIVSAFAPYKRIDLALEACKRLKRRMVVIGSGQDLRRLQAGAGDAVEFLGWQPDEVIREHYRRCRGCCSRARRIFGIVPAEAMSCGAPVIAFGRGGATETVLPLGGSVNPTGVWFEEQTVESMAEGIERFEREEESIASVACRRQAMRFTPARMRRSWYDMWKD